MEYEVSVRYSPEIVRLAARRYLVRFIRWDVVAGAIGVGLAIFFGFTWGDEWYLAGLLGALGLVLIGLVIASGFIYVRQSATRFRLMSDPTVIWRFTESSFGTRSELGSAEIPWRMIRRIWRYPEVWLLFLKGSWGYSTLATAALDPEVQEFVLSKVRANGGSIS